MRAHPFRRRCLEALDTHGRQLHSNIWLLQRDGWEIIYNAGDLIFRNQSWQANLITVWSDRSGGQIAPDLTRYEELLDRWMILERLADA